MGILELCRSHHVRVCVDPENGEIVTVAFTQVRNGR
jgi:hypothetical protein